MGCGAIGWISFDSETWIAEVQDARLKNAFAGSTRATLQGPYVLLAFSGRVSGYITYGIVGPRLWLGRWAGRNVVSFRVWRLVRRIAENAGLQEIVCGYDPLVEHIMPLRFVARCPGVLYEREWYASIEPRSQHKQCNNEHDHQHHYGS